MFQIIVSNRAKKSIKKYKKVQRSVLDLLIILQENPVPADHYDIKKIKGERDTYRVRLGEMRMIYEISWTVKKVLIHDLRPRERAYD